MDEFFSKNKGEEGWIHWWSVDSNHPHADWTVFPLVHQGQLATQNCQLLPETAAVLSATPGIRVAGFSRLQPHSLIETHTGFTGRRYGALTFHLGLIVPPQGCCLRCGPKRYDWKSAGESIIFDDTYPHSAENNSDSERIVLYIDFRIPDEIAASLPPIETYDDDDDVDKDDDDDDDDDDDGDSDDNTNNNNSKLPDTNNYHNHKKNKKKIYDNII